MYQLFVTYLTGDGLDVSREAVVSLCSLMLRVSVRVEWAEEGRQTEEAAKGIRCAQDPSPSDDMRQETRDRLISCSIEHQFPEH